MKRKRSYSDKRIKKRQKTDNLALSDIESSYVKNTLPKKIEEINTRVYHSKKLPVKRIDGVVEPKKGIVPPPPPELISHAKPTIKKPEKKVHKKSRKRKGPSRPIDPQQYRISAKREIAEWCIGIQGNPEENAIFLKRLFNKYCHQESDPYVLKVTMLSLCTLFEDLIPMYKINLGRYEKQNTKLSKEVLKQKRFEETFLSSYQAFLLFLLPKKTSNRFRMRNNPVFSNPLFRQNQMIYGSSVTCVCRMYLKGKHFNYSQNLAEYLVSLLVSTRTGEVIRRKIYDTFVQIFESDHTFKITKEIVRMVCQEIEFLKHKNISTHALDVMLNVNLSGSLKSKHTSLNKKSSKKKRKKRKKKQKKIQKSDDAAREYLTSKTDPSEENDEDPETVRIQTDILRQVVVMYVKIIKGSSNLVFCALSGLEKYSKFLNLELVYDLLKYLSDMISSNQGLNPTVLQALITATVLTQGFGEAIDTDMSIFYRELYRMMVTVTSRWNDEVCQKLLIRALFIMLVTQKHISTNRIASFIKRIATCSLQSPIHMCLVYLNFMYSLLMKYPQTQQLLTHEEIGMGTFDERSKNPDDANPFSTTLWELTMFEKTCHPHAKFFVRRILDLFDKKKQEQMMSRKLLKKLDLEDYMEIYENYHPKRNVIFHDEERNRKKIESANQVRKRFVREKSGGGGKLVFFKQSEYFFKNEEWIGLEEEVEGEVVGI